MTTAFSLRVSSTPISLWLTASLVAMGACSSPADTRLVDAGANGAVFEDVAQAPDLSDGSARVVDAALNDADLAGAEDMAPDAPPDPFESVPVCGTALLEAFTLDRLDPPAADSGAYAPPPQAALTVFEQSVRAAAVDDFQTAQAKAAESGYTICRGTGELADALLYEPTARGTGHAVLALRVRDEVAAPLLLEAPHILHDRNTLLQSVAVFQSTRARALLASGTHRCASSEAGCSGTSAVCDRADGGYAESDMAHSVRSFFQAAHVAVSESYPQDLVISLHGMGRAGASVSDGTRDAVDENSPVARVVSALLAAGVEDVTACNAGTAAPVANYLCGTTNTQGRHLNGSPDACSASSPGSSGRFVHLEQERSLRDDPTRVAAALATLFAP